MKKITMPEVKELFVKVNSFCDKLSKTKASSKEEFKATFLKLVTLTACQKVMARALFTKEEISQVKLNVCFYLCYDEMGLPKEDYKVPHELVTEELVKLMSSDSTDKDTFSLDSLDSKNIM